MYQELTDKTLTFLKVEVCLLTIKYLLSGSIKIPMSIRIIIALLLILDDIIRLVKVQVILSQVRHPEKLRVCLISFCLLGN